MGEWHFGMCLIFFSCTFLSRNTTSFQSNVTSDIVPYIGYFCVNGVCAFILGFIQIACWSVTAERQTRHIRIIFYRSILTKHVGWFDRQQVGDLISKLTQ